MMQLSAISQILVSVVKKDMTDKLTSPERPRLVLASASPRRTELLTAAGIPHIVRPAHIDESRLNAEGPEDYVLRLSREKATAAAAGIEESAVVLGADTVVLIGSEVAGKPVDEDDAERMLRALSGVWHEVLTGVAVSCRGDVRSEVSRTRVKFAKMSPAEIAWYIGTGEPFDKAGGYAIQGGASRFIKEIEGSYSNVVGLPIETVYRILRDLGIEVIV